jgi:uncharacterized protein (DUF2336 family)
MTIEAAFIEEIENAIAGASPHRRSEMLRKVTDLFISDADEFTGEDVSVFDDVIVRLAAVIEQGTRALLAKRLAPIRNAPPHTIRLLAFDDSIDVAEPVLAQSSRLDDQTLMEIARSKGQRHMLAISYRGSLSEAVTEVLVELGDQEVVLGTVDNHGANISDNGFAILLDRAEGDDVLAELVGSRPEIAPHLLCALVAKASDTVRARLEAAHPGVRTEIRRAVAEASGRIDVRTLSDWREYSAALALVEKLQQTGKLDERALAAFAKCGDYRETVAAVALMCNLPLQFAELAMGRDRSETFLAIARSLGLSASTVYEILLLRAAKGFIARGEVQQRLDRFERLQRATAQQIVAAFRESGQTKTVVPM